MTITESLKDVRFVVGPDGRPTATLVDIAAWQRVVELLEEAEDQEVELIQCAGGAPQTAI